MYGILNSRGNRLAFSDDSAYYLLCALEILDDDGNFQGKADMFSKRTIQPHKVVTSVDTAVEALTISIGERACVDLGYMSSLSGKPTDALATDLKGIIFHDPKLGTLEDLTGWVTADEYLSGNVRQKLKDAETAAAENPMYRSNVDALRAAQPKDLEASEIEVRLGATWIDKAYIQQFMYELLDTPYYLRRSILKLLTAPIVLTIDLFTLACVGIISCSATRRSPLTGNGFAMPLMKLWHRNPRALMNCWNFCVNPGIRLKAAKYPLCWEKTRSVLSAWILWARTTPRMPSVPLSPGPGAIPQKRSGAWISPPSPAAVC